MTDRHQRSARPARRPARAAGRSAGPARRVAAGAGRWAAAALAVGSAALLAGCPAADTARERSTDVDRQRAQALRADPLLAGAPVTVGDAYTGAFPGWRRSHGERAAAVPPSAPADPVRRARHVHQAVATLLGQARAAGWTVFAVRCDATAGRTPTWSLHGYRPQSGYTADLRITASVADRDPTVADGTVTTALLAPYHLDPANLLGDPPPPPLPAGGSCLDHPFRPGADQTAGTDQQVSTDHRD